MLLDRDNGKIVVMASTEGGMNIEDVARDTPERIAKVWIEPASGLQAFQSRQLAFALGLEGKAVGAFAKLLSNLYRLYIEKDCSLVEINPLVVTGANEVIALDGKVNFDDNALFRQPEIVAYRDLDEEDPREIEASKYDLNYVHLDGNVGCLVNGAGLAMATMDILKHYGSEPANFLDVGGGATAEKVSAAFQIILSDHRVHAIFINIFGGIVRCDLIAEGIIAAVKQVGLKIPVIARLQGTNMEKGQALLRESGLAITPISDLTEAAKAVVAASKG